MPSTNYLFLSLFIALLFLSSCGQEEPISNRNDYDHFLQSTNEKELTTINTNIDFWSTKLESTPNQYPYISKLAQCYTSLFDQTGRIEYLAEAENLLQSLNNKTNFAHAGYLRSLAHNYITQHKFKEALDLLEKGELNGEKLIETQKMLFDVHLELGNIVEAQSYLNQFKNDNDFDYLIRQSKWSDHQGDLDFAIYYMEKAANKAEAQRNNTLLQWSYTNLADFYGHAGQIKDAYTHYLKALTLDPSDAYAKKGIAWIAFSHDRLPHEAQYLLASISEYYSTPDLYLFQADIAEYLADTAVKENSINTFFNKIDNAHYGTMYNTYSATIIAEEKNEPQVAIRMAKQEVENRPTASSYDLLAWAFYNAGEVNHAVEIIEHHVVNKTFEPNALFHIATIYKAMGREEEKELLKQELLTSSFELGPVVEKQITSL